MTTVVHPTAVISDEANIAEGASIGPYAVIGPCVTIGAGCVIGSHTCIDGHTVIGRGNRIGRHACIGADPQDMGYKGEETRLIIGDNNVFGDYVQLCRGTSKSADRATHIGEGNYLMAYVHVGHDCALGNRIIIANAVALGGHVVVEDNAHIGGLTAIHQFIRIGRYAMVSGGSAASLDIPPFVRVAGYGCAVFGLNTIGLKRSSAFSEEERKNLKRLYDVFFRGAGTRDELLARLRREFPDDQNVLHFCAFVDNSKRGVVRVRNSKE